MLNFIKDDSFLFNMLEDVGHQFKGFHYTKNTNENGKWDVVLEIREARLNHDINIYCATHFKDL